MHGLTPHGVGGPTLRSSVWRVSSEMAPTSGVSSRSLPPCSCIHLAQSTRPLLSSPKPSHGATVATGTCGENARQTTRSARCRCGSTRARRRWLP